jgi:hypothetical protein
LPISYVRNSHSRRVNLVRQQIQILDAEVAMIAGRQATKLTQCSFLDPSRQALQRGGFRLLFNFNVVLNVTSDPEP